MDGIVFKPTTILPTDETPIPFSSALLCQSPDLKEHVLVDTMICNPIADVVQTTRDVRKLARILSKVDPSTFGLLACTGVVKSSTTTTCTEQPISDIHQGKSKEAPTFRFLFAIPTSLSSPKSLRALLIESNPWYPLNIRFDLAKQLTSSVLFIHSSQFVHKNIRPETTIIFEKGGQSASDLGGLFLVEFEKFRPAEGITYRTSDGIWQHDLCT
jgi:hypothetical protein